MARRVVLVPKFGSRLRAAREACGLTLGQVVARVHMTGPAFEGFTRGQLSRYESGLTSNPDPAVLWRLANLYKTITVQELVELLASERIEASKHPPEGLVAEGRAARARRASSR